VIVQGARHQLFSRSACAQDQHARLRGRHARNRAIHLQHFRSAADNRSLRTLVDGGGGFAYRPAAGLDLAHQRQQVVDQERLAEIFDRSRAQRFRHRLNAGMGGHDYAGALRLQYLDQVKHVESIRRAQVQIEQSQLHLLLAQDRVGGGHAVGHQALVALRFENGTEQASGRVVVIHDQDAKVAVFFVAGHPMRLSSVSLGLL